MRLADLEAIARDLQKAAELLSRNIDSAKADPDPFAVHYFAARRNFRRAIDTSGKSGKAIDRTLISTFRTAQELGFKGAFRDWEALLGICLYPPPAAKPPAPSSSHEF